MSGHNLTVNAEIRYIIQWFTEWSELQREDFLPIFAEYLLQNGSSNNNNNNNNNTENHVNGIVSALASASCDDKPMSLFQCRAKLFREWSVKWPENMKEKLTDEFKQIDTTWNEQLQNKMTSGLTNGKVSPQLIVEQQQEDEEQQQQQEQLPPVPVAAQMIQNEPVLA